MPGPRKPAQDCTGGRPRHVGHGRKLHLANIDLDRPVVRRGGEPAITQMQEHRDKGPRGRPKGPWPLKGLRDGIRIALMRRMPDGRRRIDVFAERMVDLALAGDLEASRLIADRVDGGVTATRRTRVRGV
jgi:hypothetical protein